MNLLAIMPYYTDTHVNTYDKQIYLGNKREKLIPHEGEVVIVQEGKDGGRQVLAELTKGDFFGELALLDEEPRSATAKAIESSNLIGFFRTDLLVLIKRYPDLGNKILLNLSRVLGERLRQTNLELTTSK